MNKKIKTIANGGLASHVLFYFFLLFCILFMLQITLLPVMEGPDVGCWIIPFFVRKLFNHFGAGSVFIRQNQILTHKDGPHWKNKNIYITAIDR